MCLNALCFESDIFMKKILFYNWTPIDSPLGGGVTKYIRNIISELLDENLYEIFFLNSGLKYTRDNKIRIVEVSNNFDSRVKTYELINSPVLAPIKQSVKNLQIYLDDTQQANLIDQFIKQNGINIVHINNIEGLSLASLSLKTKNEDVRFIYSIHNYTAICTTSTLWQNGGHEGHNCNKNSFLECEKCYKQVSRNCEVFLRKYLYWLKAKHIIKNAYTALFPDKANNNIFEEYAKSNIKALSQYMDYNLAVSSRVKEILVSYGLDSQKTKVSYIGTRAADIAMNKNNADIYSDPFVIIYMGYMTAEKGYEFFADSLAELAIDYPEISKKISIRIVAKRNHREKSFTNKIVANRKKFQNIQFVNGYTKNNQKELLQGANLGILPVMWEDNLPQVAIEQIAYGVPVLTSDLGGAKELCNDLNFVFKAGNVTDFINKLYNIYEHRELLLEYWKSAKKLTTMQDHVKELKGFYGE